MQKKTIKYTDFNGDEHEEEFYFNLTETELMDMSMTEEGGLDKYIERITNTRDYKKILGLFEDLVDKSYGVKSLDGKRFEKSEEILRNFKATNAYSEMIMGFVTDTQQAIDFINNLVPKGLNEKLEKAQNKA